MAAGSGIWLWPRVRPCLLGAGGRVAAFLRVWGVAVRRVKLVCGGGGCWRRSAVGEVVEHAGAAPSCPPRDGGLVVGGEGPPGADLADVRGDEQQRGEDGLGGDAADPAAGGLGEGLVGGVFGVAVEAFDGVAQGGVAGVPGR